MDKELRNTLRNTVTKCRKLLEEAIGELLQGQFGIHADGKIEDASRLTHLSSDELRYREEVLAHLEHIKASGLKPNDATAQLIREAAFTHLNRLCAYKMMAARGLKDDAIGKGLKSRGFMFYLANHPTDEALYRSAKEDLAYRHYLDHLNEELSTDIGVLFAKEDLATRLSPPHRVLTKLLDLLNSEDLSAVWGEDEAIGWVYQYFTPKELRERSRKENPAPQNSYELAFRNQFYTPRYVVEFLVDNTLGRLWYEMRKGETALNEQCEYLVRRPTEIFLSAGEEPLNLEQQKTVELSREEWFKQPFHTKHRDKKDPRDIKVLDPACGSGHFLLYCFDVLQTIYEEAYADDELGPAFKSEYPNIEEFRRNVPRLILENNLHGIDIDLRSTQISGLALWLRAQRAYKNYGIEISTRPKVKKTNIVCAEPMPGERELLEEFLKEIYPPFLSDVVRVVFDKMKLAGQAGSLLKIQEDIRGAVAEAKKHWRAVPQQQQLALFRKQKLIDAKQGALFDLSGITDEEFWNEAEARVLESLQAYAQRIATNGYELRRRLFVDDAVQGFAFIDISGKHFDVILMNPPFGNPIPSTSHLLPRNAAGNIYPAFVLAAIDRNADFIGAITDRTFMVQETFKSFRGQLTSERSGLDFLADLGWEVLDTADVQVGAYSIRRGESLSHYFLDVRNHNDKSARLISGAEKFSEWAKLTNDQLSKLPNRVFAYNLPGFMLKLAEKAQKLSDLAVLPRGLGSNKAARTYKAWYEVPLGSIRNDGRYRSLSNGGDFSPFYREDAGVAEWVRPDGKSIIEYGYADGFEAYDQKSKSDYFRAGLSFPKQSSVFNVAVLSEDAIPTREGKAIVPHQFDDSWWLLAYLNCSLVRFFVNATTGLHKQSGSIGLIPVPAFSEEAKKSLTTVVKRYVFDSHASLRADESSRLFTGGAEVIPKRLGDLSPAACNIYQEIDRIITDTLDIADSDLSVFTGNYPDLPKFFQTSYPNFLAYMVGCAFGRWDIRIATSNKPETQLPQPFESLPNIPPAALRGESNNPLNEAPSGYPIEIASDGVLVDDPNNPVDIICFIESAVPIVSCEGLHNLEPEICKNLGVSNLRDYFRKPGPGGFWMDHVKQYSKSRRQAPIYWYLRSSRGNYGLWLYFHRLDKDILHKARINYVEPKLQLEQNNLAQFRERRGTVDTTGREAKQLERELEKQESFISELHDFRDKLRRAADLNLEPDLNDGVVLNIAPLWELVPWKEAEKYWKELIAGKYEWSSIAKQLRERGLVKK